MRILIADDEKLLRVELKGILNDLLGEADILEAVNGREMISLCREYKPDLAFVDIKMPGISGMDALKTLHPLNLATRFVILSGYGEFSFARQALRLGVMEYLLKPVNSAEIRALFQDIFPGELPAQSRIEASRSGTSHSRGGETGSEEVSDRSLATVRQAEKLLIEHYESSIGVAEIAEMLNITPNYLSSQFKRWRKSSFTEFATELRMQRARELLIEPGARVSAVAEHLGYSSARYFSQLFHEYFGESPSDFISKNS